MAPTALDFQLENPEPYYPSPNVAKIVQRINNFFTAQDLKCRKAEIISQGGNHTIIKVVLDASSVGNGKQPEALAERCFLARVDFCFLCLTTERLSSVPWKLSSEVATMRYLKQNTSIPIPEIYFYDEDLDHEVGGPWMLMEFIQGQSLMRAFPGMTSEQKHSICESIADYWNQLLSLRFETIGSLGFDDKGDIVIGPLSMMVLQNHALIIPPSRDKCGPFATIREWILAVAKRELRYQSVPKLQVSAQEEARVAKRSRQAEANVAVLSEQPLLWKGQPTHPLALNPPDFRHHNVLVSIDDPTQILAVIDWEGTTTSPLWEIFKRLDFFSGGLFITTEEETREAKELNLLIWRKASKLNSEWADAMACGGSLRNAYRLAEMSDWDPNNYTLKLPDDTELLMRECLSDLHVPHLEREENTSPP